MTLTSDYTHMHTTHRNIPIAHIYVLIINIADASGQVAAY